MIAKTMAVTVVVLLALVVPWGVGSSFAGAIPPSFADGWVGFLCVDVVIDPEFPPLNVLVQVNFDKVARGGISLVWANTLFGWITNNYAMLSPFIGDNLQVTCTFTPGEIQAAFPGVTALQAAQTLSPIFQQSGFLFYTIFNSFLSTSPPYLGGVDILRTDAFLVVGANSLTYVGSLEALEELLP